MMRSEASSRPVAGLPIWLMGLLRDGYLGPNAAVFYLYLAGLQRDDRKVRWDLERFSRETPWKRRSIQRHMGDLGRVGLVRKCRGEVSIRSWPTDEFLTPELRARRRLGRRRTRG